MRAIIALSLAMIIVAVGVTACGGGGSGGGGFISSSSSSSSSMSSSSSSSSNCIASGGTNSSSAPNVATVTVDGGPPCAAVNGQGQVNILYTTVVVCAPGSTTNCQTIDHVQVDTASYGLRLLSQALQPSLASALAPVMESKSGQPLAECVIFADGYSWGSVRKADIQIAGETVSGLEVHLIGDSAYPTAPSGCSSVGGSQEDTVSVFGANGILGIGPFVDDCGPNCTTNSACTANSGACYFTCPTAASCGSALVTEAEEVSNPIAFFATDNNGVQIQLPALTSHAQASETGSLVFGIDTESNNKLTATNVLKADTSGDITTNCSFCTQSQLTTSYIDSGSNGYFFQASTTANLPTCTNNTQFYCPSSTTSFTASNQGNQGGGPSSVTLFVGNADNFSAADAAFDDLAGPPFTPSSQQNTPPSTSFDWGIPFFYGRNVYTAIDCTLGPVTCTQSTGGPGPYFAY